MVTCSLCQGPFGFARVCSAQNLRPLIVNNYFSLFFHLLSFVFFSLFSLYDIFFFFFLFLFFFFSFLFFPFFNVLFFF